MSKRIALFPGSFDPITLGHLDIIERALPLFDEIQIAVGTNSAKQYLFPLEQRVAWIEETFAHEPKVKVITYKGLTVDFAQKQGVLRQHTSVVHLVNRTRPLSCHQIKELYLMHKL